ncbi:hypothetical protein ABVT39_019609 [Epinephelus coioides]
MATVKKRKVDAECRIFQKKCTNDFFFVEVKGKPVCLVCGEALAVMKKGNLERHYSLKHAKLCELKGQMRVDKINVLRSLEQEPDVMTEYAGECAKLIQAFDERFHDVKYIQKELDMFAMPFNVQPADVPNNIQMEITELQNNNKLKAKYNNLPLLDFYKLYVRAEDFPILRRHALKFASLFGTMYRCEQFFSKLTLGKTRYRSRLTDPNLENQLRVASSSLTADIRRLAKEKQFQPSH